ncbi:MAG TPA: 50S ribosomal protein L9 [Deltaproteobacteria bacterium]|jgi:large subunit ribosomal protein L9|nr:50S ribosomal protein L9 [Deltaproteobacteria bacterium]HRW80256.1 50S ribosomal protein L9 [Desulfomonilia bacterium]NMD40614.1 50S ribosomal protein L9 [Deltaproteobacteria bacterium]HNQ85428.1 50S ribosomal protein L9 [Deltaproteobacteria bacterium]HNS89684.1 50S ribosomal protein L9 [Deltaproteobacteria bacterium]
MKVVLLETIEGLGSVGQEVKVKDGYARNFLVPKGLALLATDSNLKAFKDKIQARVRSEAKSREHAMKLSEEISSVSLSFTAKTGQEGKLFGSITSSDIFDALTAKGFELDRKKIHLHEPIRHVGTHEVDVRLFPEVTAKVKVEVVPESQGE